MPETLLNTLTRLVGRQSLGEVAAALGESELLVSSGLQATCAAILAGLAAQAADSGVMRRAFDLIHRPAHGHRILDHTTDAVSAGLPGAPILDRGGRFLALVFGGNQSAVSESVGRATGLSTQSVNTIMSFAAPVALGVLGNKVRADGLDLASFTHVLQAEAESLSGVLPANLRSILGLGKPAPIASAEITEARPAVNRWVIPALAVLALLSVWIWFANGRRTEVDRSGAASRMSEESDGAPALEDLGERVPRKLPDGVYLSIPQSGMENRLVDFIQDSTAAVDNTNWFEFDRLAFEPGSASLIADSRDQLRNIAAIMKAYPNVLVRIGGLPDNSGNATVNTQLSQGRASAVVRELTQLGVAPDRLKATAGNGHISLQVTQK
jgi:OmpA-OmpF porin, OOP family